MNTLLLCLADDMIEGRKVIVPLRLLHDMPCKFRYTDDIAPKLYYIVHILIDHGYVPLLWIIIHTSLSKRDHSVDATGSYQYRINKYEMDLGGMAVPMEHDSYSAEVGVSQPIYAGGSIYHNYKASQIQTRMADKSVDLTTDNIIYALSLIHI